MEDKIYNIIKKEIENVKSDLSFLMSALSYRLHGVPKEELEKLLYDMKPSLNQIGISINNNNSGSKYHIFTKGSIRLKDLEQVICFGDVKIFANNVKSIELRDNSYAEVSGDSTCFLELHDKSEAIASGSVNVTQWHGTKVFAKDNVNVYVEGGESTILQNNCTCSIPNAYTNIVVKGKIKCNVR